MSGEILTLNRTFDAPRERVFDAFTRKEALEAWFGPEGFTVPSCALDPRPGGRYRIEMHGPQGGVHIVTGVYREVSPPERLVFTWAWLEGASSGPETLVTLTFAARNGRTEMTLVQTGFPTVSMRDAHEGGWSSSLADLDRALAGARNPATPGPTVLGDPRSTYVRSVRLCLAEKGISYALEPHPPHSPAIDAVHPFGRIPAFRNAGLALFESSAIMRYIDEAFPGPALSPATVEDRAKMEQWASAIRSYCYPAMIQRYVLQYVIPRGADGNPDRAVIDAALPEIGRQLDILELAYGGHDFLAGEAPSLADLLLAPIVFYLRAMPEGKALVEARAGVLRAHEAMAARPSFSATLPPTG